MARRRRRGGALLLAVAAGTPASAAIYGVTATIPVGSDPLGVAVDPADRHRLRGQPPQ